MSPARVSRNARPMSRLRTSRPRSSGVCSVVTRPRLRAVAPELDESAAVPGPTEASGVSKSSRDSTGRPLSGDDDVAGLEARRFAAGEPGQTERTRKPRPRAEARSLGADRGAAAHADPDRLHLAVAQEVVGDPLHAVDRDREADRVRAARRSPC